MGLDTVINEPQTNISIQSLLSVIPRKLDPEIEVKRMFGSKIVNEDSHRSRNMPRVKKRILASMKENWPRNTACGIQMQRLEQEIESENPSFKFTHNALYTSIQHKFIDATGTHDPDHISNFHFK